MVATANEAEMLALRLRSRQPIATDIHEFELVSPVGADLPQFTAGAHVAVRVPNGLIRKYSLCNDPAERNRYVIAVKREVAGSGGSASLIDESKAGDELLVSPPKNNFALVKSPAGYLFIAGGIGITPIMSMLRQLKSSGGSPFKLYYCTRSPEATAFRAALTAPEFRGQVIIHHDGGDPGRAFDFWPLLERPKGHVYCCGPRSLMDAVRDMTGHWSSAAVHFESFVERPAVRPEDRPFTVRLARSGASVAVPVGTTILEAIRAAGHEAPSSCESGSCGTCRTRLLGGVPDHRDLVLTPDEQASNIMLCVSRAHSDEIVIDR
jgi:phthalate 4,5-dioxygenase reductase subunit